MKALTLRHIRPELARAIERKARDSKTSLSAAVIAMLEQAAGLAPGKRELHRDFERFFGRWSKVEARAFDAALAEQRKIDPEMWK